MKSVNILQQLLKDKEGKVRVRKEFKNSTL